MNIWCRRNIGGAGRNPLMNLQFGELARPISLVARQFFFQHLIKISRKFDLQ